MHQHLVPLKPERTGKDVTRSVSSQSVRFSDILLERKLDQLRTVTVDVLLTANTGCFIHLAAGVKRFRIDVEVMHVIELIALAYFGGEWKSEYAGQKVGNENFNDKFDLVL